MHERLDKYEALLRRRVDVNEIPDGEYSVSVIRAEVTESRLGDPQLRLCLEIDAGPYQGVKFFKYYTISSEAAAAYLYEDVCRCGIEAASLVEVFEVPDVFLGLRLLVEKVSNGDRVSWYFVDRMESQEAGFDEGRDHEVWQ